MTQAPAHRLGDGFGGEGRFKVRDSQFFLSNIRLVGATGAYVESDSYHLVRFDGEEPVFVIVLHDVLRRNYQRIEFGIARLHRLTLG